MNWGKKTDPHTHIQHILDQWKRFNNSSSKAKSETQNEFYSNSTEVAITTEKLNVSPCLVLLQNGICRSSDCLCGPRGPRPDRGDRMLRCPTLESVLLHRIQHCDSSGNEKLKKKTKRNITITTLISVPFKVELT